MAATPSLTITKTFTYRDNDEEWSNTYHFNGGTPASDAEWKAFADAVIADETDCYSVNTAVTSAAGHAAGTPVAVWTYDYLAHAETTPGTLSLTGAVRQAGDAAVWLRWLTANLTSRGKPIFLRSYYHDVYGQSSGAPDKILAGQKSMLETFGANWVTGYGTVPYVRAGPMGAAGSSPLASEYLTTRTLERRGKRP